MALKKTLSEHTREMLAQNIDLPWFRDLLDVLRNTGAFADRNYGVPSRPLSEMEHQSLNGSFRQGFVTCVEHIVELAMPPKEKVTTAPPQFGTLTPPTPDPKSLQQLKK